MSKAKEMKFEDGWLKRQLDRASAEVELWPLHQQEQMLGTVFTPFQRYKATKARIVRLNEELEREKRNLDKLLLDVLDD